MQKSQHISHQCPSSPTRPPTRNSSSPVCRMNWVSRNSPRNRVQQISAMNCSMYYEQTAASLSFRLRTACRTTALAFQELETHPLDHTSHNGTRKSAYCLLHVFADAIFLTKDACPRTFSPFNGHMRLDEIGKSYMQKVPGASLHSIS